MGIINKEVQIEEKHEKYDESSSEECEWDDSEDDPLFDIEKEVRHRLSRLSFTKKPKSRITKVAEGGDEENQDVEDNQDIDVPVLGEEDQKSFEALQKKIQAGQLEKLKVDQCKVYLRKYGLRLTGNKETLLRRIQEHLEVINGGGEKKYPVSSFVLNCKGDACTGDVVLFEQNVYNMFNIAFRSAGGPPCGTRVIAGRIVKESYGAAKQQHTFTIEVLWSKGVKSLPSLHPLLIKGRNLYRLKTIRQKWHNEGERQKILLEKHSRGDLARSTRQVRKMETKKIVKANRVPKRENSQMKKEENRVNNSSKISLEIIGSHTQMSEITSRREPTRLCPNPHLTTERQHLTSISLQNQNNGPNLKWVQLQHQNQGYNVKKIHSEGPFERPKGHVMSVNYNPEMVLPRRRPLTNMNAFTHTRDSYSFQQRPTYVQNENLLQSTERFERKQVCVHYLRGRCYYGDRCKYLHESVENNTF